MPDRPRRRRLDAFLPLSPVVFEILLALADDERHGYAILREVEHRSEGRSRLRPGSLYRALARLLADGLIAESDERPVPERADDARRRYYSLTPLGRQVARGEASRLAALVRAAGAKRILGKVGA
jgi:DNA-binding PadR family transcriptional regulator